VSLVTIAVIGGAAILATAAYVYRERLGLAGNARKTEVLLLRDRDKRFERVPIVNESDTALEGAKDKKGVTRHFIKRGSGYMEKGTGKTIFFAFEAGGHTAKMQGAEEEELSIPDTIRLLIGDELWEKTAPEIKDKLEKNTFGVIIEPAKTEDKAGAGNESRHTESDKSMIDYFADKVSKAMKGKIQWMPVLMGAFGGALLMLLAVTMKWIRIG